MPVLHTGLDTVGNCSYAPDLHTVLGTWAPRSPPSHAPLFPSHTVKSSKMATINTINRFIMHHFLNPSCMNISLATVSVTAPRDYVQLQCCTTWRGRPPQAEVDATLQNGEQVVILRWESDMAVVRSPRGINGFAPASLFRDVLEACDPGFNLYHETSKMHMHGILLNGLSPSRDGRMGPGIYFATRNVAERIAKHRGHDFLLKCSVSLGRVFDFDPCFCEPDRKKWADKGYDSAMGTLSGWGGIETGFTEWCVADPTFVKVDRVERVTLTPAPQRLQCRSCLLLGQLQCKHPSPSFVCPLTLELMRDPVRASDGFCFERAAIESWFRKGNTRSPLTNEELHDTELAPKKNSVKRSSGGSMR